MKLGRVNTKNSILGQDLHRRQFWGYRHYYFFGQKHSKVLRRFKAFSRLFEALFSRAVKWLSGHRTNVFEFARGPNSKQTTFFRVLLGRQCSRNHFLPGVGLFLLKFCTSIFAREKLLPCWPKALKAHFQAFQCFFKAP